MKLSLPPKLMVFLSLPSLNANVLLACFFFFFFFLWISPFVWPNSEVLCFPYFTTDNSNIWFFLITAGNEIANNMVATGIFSSMLFYLYYEMHISLPKANVIMNDWLGTTALIPLFSGFIADAYLGRYYTICLFSVIYVLVTPQLHPMQSSQ